MDKKLKSGLVDLTLRWNPASYSWESAAPKLAAKLAELTTHNALTTALAKQKEDKRTMGYDPLPLKDRIMKCAWYYRYHDIHPTLLYAKLYETQQFYCRQVLLAGMKLRLYNVLYKRVDTLQADTVDGIVLEESVDFLLEELADTLQEAWVEAQAKVTIREEATRVGLTAAALVKMDVPSDFFLKTLSYAKKFQPANPEEMYAFVSEWAPLYDIDVPQETLCIPQHESIQYFSALDSKAVQYKHTPDRLRHVSNTKQIFVESTLALEQVYFQVRWYLDNNIQPNYVWLTDAEGNRYPVLPQEASDIGVGSVVPVSSLSYRLQEILG